MAEPTGTRALSEYDAKRQAVLASILAKKHEALKVSSVAEVATMTPKEKRLDRHMLCVQARATFIALLNETDTPTKNRKQDDMRIHADAFSFRHPGWHIALIRAARDVSAGVELHVLMPSVRQQDVPMVAFRATKVDQIRCVNCDTPCPETHIVCIRGFGGYVFASASCGKDECTVTITMKFNTLFSLEPVDSVPAPARPSNDPAVAAKHAAVISDIAAAIKRIEVD